MEQEMLSTREVYGKTLVKIGTRWEKVVVLDADLSKSTQSVMFAREYPQRFFNVGISEADMMGTAAGLAASGFIPFASTFGVFATGRVYDQIRNSIAYTGLNVKIVASHTGLSVGEDGASHQTLEDIALMRVLPNMMVVVPADGRQTEQAVEALVSYKGPAYLRLNRPKVPTVIPGDMPFELGKAQILEAGKDLVFVATGTMVSAALEAAREMGKEGVKAAVVNVHTIKPFDEALLIQVAEQAGAVVVAEEHSIIGGLGSTVAEVLGESCPLPMLRVGVRDKFGESGSPQDLLEKYGLTAAKLVSAGKTVLSKKNR